MNFKTLILFCGLGITTLKGDCKANLAQQPGELATLGATPDFCNQNDKTAYSQIACAAYKATMNFLLNQLCGNSTIKNSTYSSCKNACSALNSGHPAAWQDISCCIKNSNINSIVHFPKLDAELTALCGGPIFGAALCGQSQDVQGYAGVLCCNFKPDLVKSCMAASTPPASCSPGYLPNCPAK